MNHSKSLTDHLALLFGQWFGCGLSPIAPGTVGSIGAIPLFWALRESPIAYWATTMLVSVGGILVSNRCATLLGEKDPSSVVIDEVAGVLIAMGAVMTAPWYFGAAAWILFRVLDISKPGPIDRVQYLSPPGWGIMADDLLAGVTAGALAYSARLGVVALGS